MSQTLLLYKTWLNKFDSTKSLGVCYWCVKIPQCGYMEHGLKHITYYVQKHIAALVMCYNPALVRDKPLGAPTSVKLVYWLGYTSIVHLPIEIGVNRFMFKSLTFMYRAHNIPGKLGQSNSCWYPGSWCHQVISWYKKGHVDLVTVTWTIKLVLYPLTKTPIIGRLGTSRYHQVKPNLQMSWIDMIKMIWYQDICTSSGHQMVFLINSLIIVILIDWLIQFHKLFHGHENLKYVYQ